jgi:excisionase family DNA binding protein
VNASDARATLSVPEAAQLLGIGRTLAYQLAATNRLPVPVLRLGARRLVVSRHALECLLLNGTGGDTKSPVTSTAASMEDGCVGARPAAALTSQRAPVAENEE